MKKIITNKYIQKIIKFIFNYMNLMIFICIFFGCIMFLMLINLADSANWFQTAFISFIPILILFFLKFLTKIFKNKWLIISVCIISTLYTIIYVFYIFVIVMFGIIFSGTDDIPQYEKPLISEYSQKLETLSSYKHRIKHFPKNIPQEAYNYDFCIETAFDGFNISTLKFNVDNTEYFKKIIKQNKNKIYKSINLGKSIDYYRDIESHINSLYNYPGTDQYKLYVLNFEPNKDNDKHYTSGFIISEKKKEIIFFYANYCLDLERNINGNL